MPTTLLSFSRFVQRSLLGLAPVAMLMVGVVDGADEPARVEFSTLAEGNDWLLSACILPGPNGGPIIVYRNAETDTIDLISCGDSTCSENNLHRTLTESEGYGSLDMALDGQGRPVIMAISRTLLPDPSLTADQRELDKVELLFCSDRRCSELRHRTSVFEDADIASLEISKAGLPVIVLAADRDLSLRLVRCEDSDCGSVIVSRLSRDGEVSPWLDFVLDEGGNPVIAYFNRNSSHLDLVRCGNPSCETRTQTTVDETVDGGGGISLALDSNGHPVVAYRNENPVEWRLLRCGDRVCTRSNQISILSAWASGHLGSLVLDHQDRPIISLRADWDNRLLLCEDKLCSSSDVIILDHDGYEPAPVFLDADERPYIAYVTRSYELKFARCLIRLCQATEQVPGKGQFVPPSTGNAGMRTSND